MTQSLELALVLRERVQLNTAKRAADAARAACVREDAKLHASGERWFQKRKSKSVLVRLESGALVGWITTI